MTLNRTSLSALALLLASVALPGTSNATVTVLGWPGGSEETALRATVEAYNATAGISDADKVELLFFNREGFYDKLQADMAAGSTAFDINLVATYSIGRYAPYMEPVDLGSDAAKTFGESGLLARAAAHWNELRRAPTDALAAYLAKGEAAYLILDMGDKTCLTVRDWFAASPEAAQGLLSFLARFRSVYPAARWHGAPQDDLVAAMPDKGWRLAHQEEWLLRVLDPAAALRQRGYHVDAARLALRIGEAPPLEIDIRAGKAEVCEAAGALGGAVSLQPTAFAQLFTGFRSASKLAQYGLVSGDSADIRRCDQLFAGSPPWVAEHF